MKARSPQEAAKKQKNDYHYLKAGENQVIGWYLKRLFRRADGPHLRYQDAVQIIQKMVSKKKTRTIGVSSP